MPSPIKDVCPNCGREYAWNDENDYYESAGIEFCPSGGRDITLFICPYDDWVFAVMIGDQSGGQIFIPNTKEL